MENDRGCVSTGLSLSAGRYDPIPMGVDGLRLRFTGDELDESLESIARHGLAEWFPTAEVILSPMAPGRSGAALLRADIGSTESGQDSGVYVLKVSTGDAGPRTNLDGEERVARIAAAFAEAHVPRVVRRWGGKTADDASGRAVLLDLAGGSLRRYTTAARRGSASLLAGADRVVSELIGAWTHLGELRTSSYAQLVQEALGPRTEEALSLADSYYGEQGIRYQHGHTFLSPSLMLRSTADLRVISAFQHGDFHNGNLILPIEPDKDGSDFWIIDFDRAGEGFFPFDICYFELSLIVDFYEDLSPSSLAQCLDYAEFPERNFSIPDDLQWLATLMKKTRAALSIYVTATGGRSDDLERQLIVARMIEALRWASRNAGRRKSHLALTYAGWYAAHYDRLFPDELERVEIRAPPLADSTTQILGSAEREAWEGLWNDAARFARPDWTYVLVAERLGFSDGIGALGRLPWSAVVDLDPSSDYDGLYSQAGPVLGGSRAVHVYSETVPSADTKRGTLWLMSAGWRLRREPHMDFRQWFRSRLRVVRGLFEALRHRAGDENVFVLALAGKHDAGDEREGDRLVRVLDACDEAWEGRASVHLVADADIRSLVPLAQHPLSPHSFVQELATIFGAEESTAEYRLPSQAQGTVVVQHDTLQVLREHLEILHDRIALDEGETSEANDAFWRGGQILWSDLAEDLDVPRAVAPELHRALEESLERHRTHTVVLQHRPGAGGTTTALRAAWDLHRTWPVAVLRSGQTMTMQRVRLLADRLHRLFVLTDSPVLLVVDSADLTEAYRESLYRELAARNARVTLLYVRRSLAPSHEQLSVNDPLTDEEARFFLARFRQLTAESVRIEELELLSSDTYARYRSPFFYGLITYQREFTKVADYVGYHIRELAGRGRDVLAHLALVTLYSNSGLQLGLLQQLFRLSVRGDSLNIEDLLGSASALIVQRGGRYRVAHQLIAEELLARLAGTAAWRLHLNDLALDFIEDVCSVADTSAEPVRVMLRQVFIDRVSGVTEGVEDRGVFSPLIEELDGIDASVGHRVLLALTDEVPDEPHFWNHLGRHQIYRLNRDLDVAEQHLERAVALSPDDALHHHTLGLARRARLRHALRTAEGQGTESVMTAIAAWFDRTVECFERARALTPDDIYGYITHVQTVLGAIRALRTAARVETIAHIPSVAGEWVVEQITVANGLLDDASQLYGTLDRQDDYLQSCLADIQRLYGDLDAVVELWEVGHARGITTPYSRRALAQAYLVRAKRSWRALSEPELRRIASLAEDNLRRAGARDEDYRLWFEARKLLPDFDMEEALAHLELWSARLPTWRAAYYRYVLQFLLWFAERSDDPRAMEAAQDDCVRLVPGRKAHSYAWLGGDPSWCPLVADSDLGEWDRRQRFWHDTSLLQRVNGVVDLIDGPASGRIMIDDTRVQAFFVPAAGGFIAQADENLPVNFFVGFSPSGIRAWDVQRGHDPAGRTRGADVTAVTVKFVTRPRQAQYEESQAARLHGLKRSRLRDLTIALTEAALARGDGIALASIEERVLATIGIGSQEALREGAVRRMVMSLPGAEVQGAGEEAIVRRRREDAATSVARAPEVELGFVSHFDPIAAWGVVTRPSGETLRFSREDVDDATATAYIRRNGVVRFLPSRDRREERALRVDVLPEDTSLYEGRIVSAAELPPLVKAEIRGRLEAALAEDRREIPAWELEDALEQTFRGGLPLAKRLGVNGLRTFLRGEPWLIVRGQPGTQVIALREPFGSAHDAGKSSLESAADATAGVAASVREAVDELAAKHQEVTLQLLGPNLKQRLGQERYAVFTADRGLMRALRELGEWSLKPVREGVVAIRPATADATDSTDPTARKSPGSRRASGDTAAEQDVAAAVLDAFDDLEARNTDVRLTALGSALKARLGEAAYAGFTENRGLKRAIRDLAGWEIEQSAPGVDVVRKRRGPAAHEGTKSRPVPPPSERIVAEAVDRILDDLLAQNRRPNLQSIGPLLQAALGGESAYRAFLGGDGLKSGLERLGRWELQQGHPGELLLQRKPDPRSDG